MRNSSGEGLSRHWERKRDGTLREKAKKSERETGV